ncbi:MAG: N-methyl-D-aspartate receptor NMDAR2C subunit [Candidatus Saccharibacteria bacterium]|nr:N-methyl-D-aspartate receptor NMDAR2C subunit [Moraxellaceae bacterium]
MTKDDLLFLQCSWQRSFISYEFSNNHHKSNDLFELLLKHYAEPQRHYHTLQHLVECITKLELVYELLDYPHEVEVALWFHDAIYDVKGKENEHLSALWAKESLVAVNASTDEIDRIFSLIMATQHTHIPHTLDEQTLVDIDLSILGEEIDRFNQYDVQVRQEYAWVPEEVYRVKRAEILETFLARPFIYTTAYFRNHFEVRARQNLQRSILQLQL